MSYDFSILAQDGSPEKQIGLSVDEHHQLVEQAKALNLALIARCSDYYEDVEFSFSELNTLIIELESILSATAQKDSLSLKIKELINLCKLAVQNESGLCTIAD